MSDGGDWDEGAPSSNLSDDFEKKASFRDNSEGGYGGERGGSRGGRGRGGRGGRGGYSRDNDDEEGGSGRGGRGGGYRGRGGRGGGHNRDEDDGGDGGSGDEGSRRGRGGYRGGRGGGRRGDDDTNDNEKQEGEGEPERPPVYIPEAELEGEEAFSNRKEFYSGSGINFDKYNDIKVEVNGKTKAATIASFSELGLRELVMENIKKVGYSTPTPIQRNASPQLMTGLDVMACAQTGSGKTAAFLLPIINCLLTNQDDLNMDTHPVKPEALILAPTRELAIQINREARLYSQDSILRSTVVYGGAAIFAQRNQLQGGCNILVATPGRLKQFITEGIVCMSQVKFFVLDEADRMLDMGFMGDVNTIIEKMPGTKDRVSGMFSATFPVGVQKAAQEFLKDEYVFVTIGVIGGACSDVVQEFISLERSEKRSRLLDILKGMPEDEKVLVFCNSKKGADFLAASLCTSGISTTSIHGDRLQSQRELALKEFTQGKRRVLVATAVAARGLDIPKVALVVNYDLPTDADEYVHRIGRTGRVGHSGKAISFYEESQDNALAGPLKTLLTDAGQQIPEFLEDVMGSGLGGGGNENGFSSIDARGKVSAGAPKAVENDEEDWD